MFSQTAEYALRIIVHLAEQNGSPVTTRQIAAATGVPEGYLAKVLQGMARAGLVDSHRGLHGGFILSRDARALTLFDVIQSVTPIQRIDQCPLGIESHDKGNYCALHQRLDEIMAGAQAALRRSTIHEVLRRGCLSCPDPNPAPAASAQGDAVAAS